MGLFGNSPVISWELSETMDTSFCAAALERALSIAIPAIHNSDQGSQFTSAEHTDILKSHTIAIGMDGRGRCFDNIFTERLWRTVKYENVYLRSYQNIREARAGLAEYFQFYNEKRRHQSLNRRTPAEIYFQENVDKRADKKTTQRSNILQHKTTPLSPGVVVSLLS